MSFEPCDQTASEHDMEEMTIEVYGVPDLLPVDRIVDKLTIHFLRPRNGGGEIVRVIYPTSTKGQAFVVYEQKEVAARVAGARQTLDIDGQQFPLKVAIVDGSAEDLPVQATLDISKFPDQSEIRQLLKKHNFKVTELSHGKVLLEGTFLSLRAVRSQLLKLLQAGHNTQHIRERSASASIGRPTTAHNDVLPRKSSTLPHANGTHGCGNELFSSSVSRRHFSLESSSGRRSPSSLDSSSSSSDQPLPLSSSRQSRERVRSHRQQHGYLQDSDAPQSLPILPSEHLASKPPLQSRALSPRELSPRALSPRETSSRETSSKETTFGVDSNGFTYTWCFKKAQVDNILMVHGVSVSPSDMSGVTILTLKGKDCEGAKSKLQDLINHTSMSLRVQEILLTDFNHDEQIQISKRIQRYKDVYNKVLVRQDANTIVLIGSSVDSYEMKQRLLGQSVDDTVGSARVSRTTERGPRMTRSSSLPKQQKVRPDPDHTTRVDNSYGPSSTMPYSPSHYQDVSGATVGAVTRGRPSSLNREKMRSQRSVPMAAQQDLAPVSSSSKVPQIKKPALLSNLSFKNLKGHFSHKH